MGHAVFVFGAAGVGKTTFCRNIREQGAPSRHIRLINLDPANTNAKDYDVDLCDYITVTEVMKECDYGPNGGLFVALDEMIANIDVLELHQFENEYFIFDCPGQVELFLHSDIMIQCARHVGQFARVILVYITDGTCLMDPEKYLHTALCATICMQRFELPIINILSKGDLVDEELMERAITSDLDIITIPEEDKLSQTIKEYVEYNGMMDYFPLNWDDKSTVDIILTQMDHLLQRFDDIDPEERE